MKRLLTSLLLCFSLATVAMAQTSVRVEGSAIFDKKQEPSADQNSILNQVGLNNSTGFRLGAALEFKFFGFFYLSPGLNYHLNSTKLLGGAEFGDSKATITSHSLTLPVNLGFRLKPLGLLGVSVEAGPYASYNLSNNSSSINSDAAKKAWDDVVNAFDKKKLTYGINASAAVEFATFFVRGGILYPLSDKFDLDEIGKAFKATYDELNASGIKSKTLTYFLGLGLRF